MCVWNPECARHTQSSIYRAAEITNKRSVRKQPGYDFTTNNDGKETRNRTDGPKLYINTCALVTGASPVTSILKLQAYTKEEGEKPDANPSDIA